MIKTIYFPSGQRLLVSKLTSFNFDEWKKVLKFSYNVVRVSPSYDGLGKVNGVIEEDGKRCLVDAIKFFRHGDSLYISELVERVTQT